MESGRGYGHQSLPEKTGFLKAVNRLPSEEMGGQPMSESTGGSADLEQMVHLPGRRRGWKGPGA